MRAAPAHQQHRAPPPLVAGSRPLQALRQLHPRTRRSSNAPTTQLQQRVGAVAPNSTAPELSHSEQQLLQQLLNYQYTADLPEGGQLVVSALRENWLQRAADLLADSFVDAKGIQPYRRYVRRTIGRYLEQHIKMPPATVMVTAVLRTEVEGTDLGLHDLQPPTSPASPASSSSSGSSSPKQQGQTMPQDMQQPADHPLTRLLLGCFGWLVTPNTAPEAQAAATSSSNTAGTDALSEGPGVAAAGNINAPAGDAYAAVSTVQQATNSTNSSSSTSSSKSEGTNVAAMVNSALQRLSDSVTLPQLRLQQQKPSTRIVETLVGVAEVSFKDRTRSQAITLNPPEQCAYLCNMAVATAFRRQGIASALLTAVEDLCLLAGESDLYLHLRFKDSDSAGALYRKHGFAQAKKDWWLLLLIGQEPRFLMLKQLAAARTLVGQVLLPGFKQGATAAELLQPAATAGVGGEGTPSSTQQQPQQPAPAATPAA